GDLEPKTAYLASISLGNYVVLHVHSEVSARPGRKLVLQLRKSHVISRQCSHNRCCVARSVTLDGTRSHIRSSNLDSVRKTINRDPSHVRRIRTRVIPESPITIYTTHDDNWLISTPISLR